MAPCAAIVIIASMPILIATAAYGSVTTTDHGASVMPLLLDGRGHKFLAHYLDHTNLDVTRNFYASLVLEKPQFSHLLFVDADMGFAPDLILKMIAFDKPVVGAVYPRRSFDLSRFHALAREIDDPKQAQWMAQAYVPPDDMIDWSSRSGDFVRVKMLGAGVLLIRRDALVTMRERFPSLWVDPCGAFYRGFGLTGGVLQCFSGHQSDNGIFASEDVAFCERWRDGCGGELWACISEEIRHTGRFTFAGKYGAAADLRSRPASPQP
jgi:hypothetical protein